MVYLEDPLGTFFCPWRNYPEQLRPVGTCFEKKHPNGSYLGGVDFSTGFVLLNQGMPMRARVQSMLNVERVFCLSIFSRNVGGKTQKLGRKTRN